jgi:predicted dehydrogenase
MLAGGALAAPLIVPASALGRDGAVAPSERIVTGAIGIGGRGSGVVSWMIGQKDVQFVAVCDVHRGRREAARQQVDSRYGNTDCAAYRDIREFLAERDDVDAVLIATGDRWHALASILAMRAGKDVYCEKPACLTIAQGKAVADTAQRCGRVYTTGAQRLSEPNHVFAIEMARSGRLGPVHTVYADVRYRGGSRRDWLAPQPQPATEELDWDLWLGPCPWRPYNSAYIGGGWYNHHDFATDVAMWGAHTVAQALAGLDLAAVNSIEFEFAARGATIMTRLSNGVKMVLFRDPGDIWGPCRYWHGACGERFDGPEGWVAAADGYSRPDVSSPAMLVDYRSVLAQYAGRTRRPMSHVTDFFECIRSRRPPVADPQAMLRSMSICLAADICDQLQRNLKLDLVKYEFPGDAEANRLAHRAMRQPWMI